VTLSAIGSKENLHGMAPLPTVRRRRGDQSEPRIGNGFDVRDIDIKINGEIGVTPQSLQPEFR